MGAPFVRPVTVTNDGRQYLAVAAGRRVCRPFHYRWFVPKVVGSKPARWKQMTVAAVVTLAALFVWYAGTVWAAVVPFALAGVMFNVRYPVLVDLPAMVFALAAANCAREGWIVPAALLAVVAGMTKETAPLFAALWAWNPIVLVGLAAPAVRHLFKAGPIVSDDPRAVFALAHPFRAGREAHSGRLADWRLWLAPWGPLCFGFVPASPQTIAVLAAAYGQCVVATDTVRLYVWAAPVVAANLFELIPASWAFLAATAIWFWPWKGDGQ